MKRKLTLITSNKAEVRTALVNYSVKILLSRVRPT
jgi:hypothetical protein